MTEKRPIDRLRDSAGSFTVGASDDQSAITGFVKVADRLYIAKEKGIYEVKLADQIDPGRTNVNVPSTHQRVLRYGSEMPFVARTLLTAHKLFDQKYFPAQIDAAKVVQVALSAVQEFAAMQDIADETRVIQESSIEGLKNDSVKNRVAALPEIGNLKARVKNFIQNMDHAYKALFETTQIFYGTSYKKRWFEGFARFLNDKYDLADPFVQFVDAALPLLRLFRYMRDCVEHPSTVACLEIIDFEMSIDGKIVLPTVRVIHPETPLDRTQVVQFMYDAIENLSLIYESMLAYLADRHVNSFAGLHLGVFEFDSKQLGERHVRFSYGVMSQNGPIRFG